MVFNWSVPVNWLFPPRLVGLSKVRVVPSNVTSMNLVWESAKITTGITPDSTDRVCPIKAGVWRVNAERVTEGMAIGYFVDLIENERGCGLSLP
jgi:hypothetical protein